MMFPPQQWTPVATRVLTGTTFLVHAWRWDDYDPKAVRAAAESGEIVLMHRHAEGRVELVARPAGKGWRKLQRWFAAHPLPARGVRR